MARDRETEKLLRQFLDGPKGTTESYRDNWTRIFKPKHKPQCATCQGAGGMDNGLEAFFCGHCRGAGTCDQPSCSQGCDADSTDSN